jgi:hypothetical protein
MVPFGCPLHKTRAEEPGWHVKFPGLSVKSENLRVLIAGCRGIIPLPGCLRGSAPQGLDFDFQTPLRGHKREHKKSLSRRSLRDRKSSQGRRGERGQRPLFPLECKVKVQKLTLASAKPTLSSENQNFGELHSERRLRRREREFWYPNLRILAATGGAAPSPPDAPARIGGDATSIGEESFVLPMVSSQGRLKNKTLRGAAP